MTIDPTPNTPPHRARKVIDAALDAWLHDDGGESTRADQILSALAAAGLAIYDTATHAAVPREPTRAMWTRSGDALVNDRRLKRLPAHHDHIGALVWNAMLAAAEAEAKGDPDV